MQRPQCLGQGCQNDSLSIGILSETSEIADMIFGGIRDLSRIVSSYLGSNLKCLYREEERYLDSNFKGRFGRSKIHWKAWQLSFRCDQCISSFFTGYWTTREMNSTFTPIERTEKCWFPLLIDNNELLLRVNSSLVREFGHDAIVGEDAYKIYVSYCKYL